MKQKFGAIVLLGFLSVCRTYSPAANPPMLTHASMDVGNIISIVIPESPDENINIDQLTVEFRQQLERIKKQSRASKVEHGLVTLKRVLPEMSREEKRKTLPMIRRVLHGRRVANPGTPRNWTRDQRVEQIREGGQFAKNRGNPDERRIHRDYEDSGIREAATSRLDQTVENSDYRRANVDRAYRREEFPRRDEPSLREERVPSVEDDGQTKIPRSGSGQDWSQNWDDQYRGEIRNNPETSTADCNHKLDRTIRQKDPANEIAQNDRYEKPPRFPEIAPNNPDENAECAKLNHRPAGRYSTASRSDINENSKRNVKDARGYETADAPAYISYPREFDANPAIDPNCENPKRTNGTLQSLRDLERNRGELLPEKSSQRQEPMNLDTDDYRTSRRFVQESRDQSDRSNASGFENVVNEGSDDYAGKKKRGPEETRRGFSASGAPIDRWNGPSYEERSVSNSSDEPRDSPNVYEMFSEKGVNPALSYIQTEQGGFRRNMDTASKHQGSQMAPNYGAEGLALRIQRAISDSPYKIEISKIDTTDKNAEDLERIADKGIFARLKHLFKAPEDPKAYDRIVVVHADKISRNDGGVQETFTEDGRSQSTLSASVAEPSSSTSQDVPGSTTDYMTKPRLLSKI